MTGNPETFAEAETPAALLGELAGAASVCWSTPEGAGVFDSTLAAQFVEDALARLEEVQQ